MILVPGPGGEILAQAVASQAQLPVPLDPEHIKIAKATFVGQTGPTHSRATVIPSPLSPYQGTAIINYDRMDLNKAFGDIIPHYEGVSQGTLYSIYPGLSQFLGIDLNQVDFKDADYSWLDLDETTNLKIEAKPDSIAYRGYFIVRFTRRRILLQNVIKKPHLYSILDVGRTYRAPPKPGPGVPAFTVKDSVNMATYGTDFTPYREQMRQNTRFPSLWKNPSAVAAIMRNLFGYTSWPSGWPYPIAHYKTSQRPEARQDFEFVIIQQVVDPYYPYRRKEEGTAYFHYNETEIIVDED